MPNQLNTRRLLSRWYRPEKATVIVAGDVDPARVFPLVEKYFGDWQKGSFSVDIPQEPEHKGPVYAHVPWTSPTLPWVTVAFHGPAALNLNDQAAFDTMYDLSFGQTSDLYKRLVEQEQKVDQMFFFGGRTSIHALLRVRTREGGQGLVTSAIRPRDSPACDAEARAKRVAMRNQTRATASCAARQHDAIASTIASAATSAIVRPVTVLTRLSGVGPTRSRRGEKYSATRTSSSQRSRRRVRDAMASCRRDDLRDLKTDRQHQFIGRSRCPNVWSILFTHAPRHRRGRSLAQLARDVPTGSRAIRIDESTSPLSDAGASSASRQGNDDVTASSQGNLKGSQHRPPRSHPGSARRLQLQGSGSPAKQDLRQHEEELGRSSAERGFRQAIRPHDHRNRHPVWSDHADD